jgi:NAD-dependent dihydropyrimidine dehydrogenase PreA subunit
MAKRKIIKINNDLCNGCGLCVPDCAEGALQIVDGKARLISDLFCDGLGGCLGTCPTGAIEVEEREAAPYDEKLVMKENIVPAGPGTIKVHLEHLKAHGADEYYNEAVEYLKENGIDNPVEESKMSGHGKGFGGCPGSRSLDLSKKPTLAPQEQGSLQSQLGHWPVQISLLSPNAPFLKNADLVIMADCVAFAYANTHRDFIAGNAVGIGCPKLDNPREYVEKISEIIKLAKPKSIKVVKMQVPCCSGLVEIVKQAIIASGEVLPFESTTISINGEKM